MEPMDRTATILEPSSKQNKAEREMQMPKLNNQFISLLRIPVRVENVETMALIDTGCPASLISKEMFDRLPKEVKGKKFDEQSTTFRNASGAIMESEGRYEFCIYLDHVHKVKYAFYVMPQLVEKVIIGMDLITDENISINGASRIVTIRRSEKSFNIVAHIEKADEGISSSGVNMTINAGSKVTEEQRERIAALMENYKDIFGTKPSDVGVMKGVQVRVKLQPGPPVRSRPYRMPRAQYEEARKQIDEMLQNGIIRQSNSPYSAPVLLVPKKNGKSRFCVDFRALNERTVKDPFMLPRIDSTIDELHGSTWLTNLDFLNGFWNLEVAEKDRHKLAFTCPLGHYEYCRLPFGWTNSPGVFQRELSNALRPVLGKCAMQYLDDIVIYSKDFESHLRDIEAVFKIIRKIGVRLNPEKCTFMMDELKFLGFLVSSKGVATDPKSIEPILNYKAPRNVEELRKWLGMTGYYRKWICSYSKLIHPLVTLTKKDQRWTWGKEQEDAFRAVKQRLITPPILAYPDFKKQFHLQTDASQCAIGAVLAQIQNVDGVEKEVVIAYLSKHLSPTECRWSTIEKEMYSIVHAVKVFYPYLYGQRFYLWTDHQPLRHLQKMKDTTGKLARWAMFLQEFDMEIKYRKGAANGNADFLSRIPGPSEEGNQQVAVTVENERVNLIIKEFQEEQEKDPFCIKLRNQSHNNEQQEEQPERNEEQSIGHETTSQQQEEDSYSGYISEGSDPQTRYVTLPNGLIGTENRKVYVPRGLRDKVLHRFHSHKLAGHLGVHKTISRIRRRFIWPKMTKDIRNFVRGCLICAKRKSHGASKAPLQPVVPPKELWDTVAMDIIGPISPSRSGNCYILTMVEYTSRYVEAVALPDQTAESIAKAFINTIILRHGLIRHILHDQGANFLSNLMEQLCKQLGVKQIRTTAYHPQTDLAEARNKVIIDVIACYVQEEPDRWDEFLPFACYAYNTSDHISLDESPFYLVYGREVREPADVWEPTRYRLTTDQNQIFAKQWRYARKLAREKLLEAQEKQKQYYDRNAKVEAYAVGDQVLLKARPNQPGKFTLRWTGPYQIVRKMNNPLNYKLRNMNNKEEIVVHSNRIKKFKPAREENLGKIPEEKQQKESQELEERTEENNEEMARNQVVVNEGESQESSQSNTKTAEASEQNKDQPRYNLRAARHIKVPSQFRDYYM